MKLEPNRDGNPIPGVSIAPKEWEPQTLLEKWIASFPYDSVPPDEGQFHFSFRCGETREIEGRKQYRRLRVSVMLSDWLPFAPDPDANS